MAWYYGTYKCGHEGRIQVYGKIANRQWKADRVFEGLCEECYRKEREKYIENQNNKALELSNKMELPQLEGSEKQIAWANSLRLQFIDKLRDFLECNDEYKVKKINNLKVSKEVKLKVYNHLDDSKKEFLKETSAKFYIDSRFDNPIDLFLKFTIKFINE